MTSGMRSASERRLGVAECEAGVPGAEKSRDGEGEGLVRGVRSEELKEEKSITSPFSRTISGRRPRLVNLTGVEEVLRSRKPAASFWALRISLASWVRDLFSFSSMADSTGLRLTRFLSPSTVMMGSRGGFEAAKEDSLLILTAIELLQSLHTYNMVRRTPGLQILEEVFSKYARNSLQDT